MYHPLLRGVPRHQRAVAPSHGLFSDRRGSGIRVSSANVCSPAGAMLSVPQTLALLYAAPARSDEERRMRRLSRIRAEPAKALSAASLIELVLAGRVTVESRRQRLFRSDVVVVTNAASIEDPLLDNVLRQVAESEPRSCTAWIKRLAEAVGDPVATNSLRSSAVSVRDDPVVDEEAVRRVKDQLRAVLAQTKGADPRAVALVILMTYTDLLPVLLDNPESSVHGALGAAKAARRDESLGHAAVNVYSDVADLDAVVRIARAAEPDSGH